MNADCRFIVAVMCTSQTEVKKILFSLKLHREILLAAQGKYDTIIFHAEFFKFRTTVSGTSEWIPRPRYTSREKAFVPNAWDLPSTEIKKNHQTRIVLHRGNVILYYIPSCSFVVETEFYYSDTEKFPFPQLWENDTRRCKFCKLQLYQSNFRFRINWNNECWT